MVRSVQAKHVSRSTKAVNVLVGLYAARIEAGAPVYMTVVLEYLIEELMELAGNCARDYRQTRIFPRHIQIAIKHDEELISQGGVLPGIHAVQTQNRRKD